MIGPGKIELLERIRSEGSISAAGRGMKMSYKRAWMLVEEMNAAFRAPLVESARGGPGGGGAQLTETGEAVVRHYRALIAATLSAGAGEIAAIEGLLRGESGGPEDPDMSDGK
nr:LysR family transcriptional regulator [Acidimangrovimonas sediminis]